MRRAATTHRAHDVPNGRRDQQHQASQQHRHLRVIELIIDEHAGIATLGHLQEGPTPRHSASPTWADAADVRALDGRGEAPVTMIATSERLVPLLSISLSISHPPHSSVSTNAQKM